MLAAERHSAYTHGCRPAFSFAPAAGRFALGRSLWLTVAVDPDGPLPEGVVSAEEVARGSTSYDGRVLFKIDCTPWSGRWGELRAISGWDAGWPWCRETVAASCGDEGPTTEYTERRGAAVEVYVLRRLTEKDQADGEGG